MMKWIRNLTGMLTPRQWWTACGLVLLLALLWSVSIARDWTTTIPLVVNGDILSYDDARKALAQSGADAVMIGRGAQGQPWLPGQIGRRRWRRGPGCGR